MQNFWNECIQINFVKGILEKIETGGNSSNCHRSVSITQATLPELLHQN